MANRSLIQQMAIKQVISDGTSYVGQIGALNRNLMVMQNQGQPVLTSRPAFWLVTDGSAEGEEEGRGVYRPVAGIRLYVNGVNVYTSAVPESPLTNTLNTTAGIARKYPVFFEFLDDKIIICDPLTASGKGLYYTESPWSTLTQMTDADIPPQLANGVTQLSGYLFIIDRDGNIRNSDINDPTSYSALGTITAQRTVATYANRITRHLDNVAVFKDDSIEFFYVADNPTGSPLKRNENIFYEIGSHRTDNSGGYTVTKIREKDYFVGFDNQGAPGVYVIERFRLRKISDEFTDLILKFWQNFGIVGAGLAYAGKNFYVLTALDGTTGLAIESIVIDTETGYTCIWDSDLPGLSANQFALMPGHDYGSSAGAGFGIATNYQLQNGDVIGIADNLNRVSDNQSFVEYPVDIEVRTDPQDYGTIDEKTMNRIGLLAYDDQASGVQSFNFEFSDDGGNTYSAPQSITLNPEGRQELQNLGTFYRRSMRMTAALTERAWIQGIDERVTK